jgi:tetratricopeptide (TPR) repeat protein
MDLINEPDGPFLTACYAKTGGQPTSTPPPVASRLRSLWLAGLLVAATAPLLGADETNGVLPGLEAPALETNAPAISSALAGFEAQLRANQAAVEEGRKEAREAAERNAEVLSTGLRKVEEAFAAQQRAMADRYERELTAVQRSTRAVVILGGVFATVASMALLMVAYFQWRMSKAWTEMCFGPAGSERLSSGRATKELEPGSLLPNRGDSAQEADVRLSRALERLETRVHDLEQGSTAAVGPDHQPSAPDGGPPSAIGSDGGLIGFGKLAGNREPPGVVSFFEKGQFLMRQSDWDGALNCFNEVLTLDPVHGEALVKKGAALVKLKRLNEAFECYDQAIAAHRALTSAYLHKGGLCSRLERFKEALECYEQALRTQD